VLMNIAHPKTTIRRIFLTKRYFDFMAVSYSLNALLARSCG